MNSSLSRPTALSACFGNLLPKQLNNILLSQDFFHSGPLAWVHTIANARGLARRANEQRMTSTTERLAAAILADHARPTTQHNIVPCFVCGHTFVYKGRKGDLNGRFCSMRCQEWYDAGHPVAITDSIDCGMKRGSKGFYIDCAGCHKEFESLGQRCGSTECERRHRERRDNLAVMAEVGVGPIAERGVKRRAKPRSPNGARAGRSPARLGTARRNVREKPKGPLGARTGFWSSKRSKRPHKNLAFFCPLN